MRKHVKNKVSRIKKQSLLSVITLSGLNLFPFQDLAAFSEDNFDPKEWINKTFKNAESQVSKEVSINVSKYIECKINVQNIFMHKFFKLYPMIGYIAFFFFLDYDV